MTGQQWLASSDPRAMLDALKDHAVSDRKLRLFACACCRHTVGLEHVFVNMIEFAEWRADGKARDVEANVFQETVGERPEYWHLWFTLLNGSASDIIGQLSDPNEIGADFHRIAASELRCIIGNPFPEQTRGPLYWMGAAAVGVVKAFAGSPMRPEPEVYRCTIDIEFDPRWLTSNVVDLAQAIYQERAFEKMPILADALMDAGCDTEEIIQHCRGDGPHVRGCWVVDLLTGRE